MTRFAVCFPVRPAPRPEPSLPAVAVTAPPPAGAHGCTGHTKAGGLCNGIAGKDGHCARHKE